MKTLITKDKAFNDNSTVYIVIGVKRYFYTQGQAEQYCKDNAIQYQVL